MALTTARDLIKESLELIGVVAAGEEPSANDMTSGLNSLNLLLSMWGGRNLMTTSEIRESFSLVASQVSYLMGVDSIALPVDFNTPKPSKIVRAFIRDTNDVDYPVTLISRDQYDAIPDKDSTGVPNQLAQDPGATQQTNQVMTVYLYPAPTDATYTIFLFSEKPLTWVSALDDTITMEDVYLAAIPPNLATILAQKFGKALHPETKQLAKDTLSVVETINASQKRPVCDLFLPTSSKGNIYRGR